MESGVLLFARKEQKYYSEVHKNSSISAHAFVQDLKNGGWKRIIFYNKTSIDGQNSVGVTIMTIIKILMIAFFILLAVLAIYGIHALFETIRDNRVMNEYNAKMDRLRKERKWEETEKQRKIRGEEKGAPKYAAGDEMDRINRNAWYF